MTIRKATAQDLPQIGALYADIHTAEEAGAAVIGWARDVYPTEMTAHQALNRDDLFVQEVEGQLVGAAIINRQQVDVYAGANWQIDAPDSKVMVLHTLVIQPSCFGQGYGTQFVHFYEQYAYANGCTCLRIDTNERNLAARTMYRKLGYRESDVVPCIFNGIAGVRLVLLEKQLPETL